MKYSKVIWGLILVCAGVFIILKNTHIFEFQWSYFFNLWPLILIFIGISKLPVKDYVKLILSVIAFALGIYILFNSKNICSNNEQKNEQIEELDEQLIHKPFNPSIKKAVLHLNSSIANISISGSTNNLIDFNKTGNLANYNLSVQPVNDSVTDIYIDMDYNSNNLKKKSIIS